MTIAERKRAKKLQSVIYLYCKAGKAFNGILITAILQAAIIIGVLVIGMVDNKMFMVVPIVSMLTFLPFLVCLIATGIDRGLNDKAFKETYRGTSMTSNFLCNLPFKAKDVFNFKLILWEEAAAANVLAVILGHVISLAAEAHGFAVYHGVSGLFTLLAVISEALLMLPFIIKSNVLMVVLTVGWGIGFSVICGFMDMIPDASADTLAPLKIFSGISGILIYCAATLFIAFLGEMYIKHRKNVSWRLSK